VTNARLTVEAALAARARDACAQLARADGLAEAALAALGRDDMDALLAALDARATLLGELAPLLGGLEVSARESVGETQGLLGPVRAAADRTRIVQSALEGRVAATRENLSHELDDLERETEAARAHAAPTPGSYGTSEPADRIPGRRLDLSR
jgi:hypothetical protein